MKPAGTDKIYDTKENQWIFEQNAAVAKWSSMVTRKLKGSARQFVKGKTEGMVLRGKKKGDTHTETKLAQSLNRKIYMDSGIAEGIGFKIERHGVFVHKGVGRGYIVSGGMVMRGFRTGKTVMDMAKAKNRRVAEKQVTGGTIVRRPVEWFNPILDAHMPELCDRIAVINGDKAINAVSMYIK